MFLGPRRSVYLGGGTYGKLKIYVGGGGGCLQRFWLYLISFVSQYSKQHF